jgi:hypothetical protein
MFNSNTRIGDYSFTTPLYAPKIIISIEKKKVYTGVQIFI